MACNSGCFNDDTITPTPIPKDGTTTVRRICFKCKATDALDSNNTDNCNVEAITNFCFDCFRANLYGKFKQAVTAHDMISPTDNVLVAFSGGPASRVALQFVHEMQSKAQRNLDASRDKLYPVFGVGVAFVDESAVRFNPSHEEENTLQDMRLIMSTLAPPTKELHITPIESIVSSESNDGRNKLKELLDIIVDVTGREDFLQHLRMLSLQKISIDKGYTKLVVGSCTSRVACHVISATVKGQGYSLPADIQHVDARWEIPVVLPLRDCLMQELAMLCRLDSLKTLDVSNGPHPGINGLVSSFISILQEENPAREHTIVRTAGKLIPFYFNKLPETKDSNVGLPSRWRRKKHNLKADESNPSEVLCPICSGPLNKLDLQSSKNDIGNCESVAEMFGASCCSSCRFQILPEDMSSIEHFHSLLPQPMFTRSKDCVGGDRSWLREQIKDCLLSDTEDDT